MTCKEFLRVLAENPNKQLRFIISQKIVTMHDMGLDCHTKFIYLAGDVRVETNATQVYVIFDEAKNDISI